MLCHSHGVTYKYEKKLPNQHCRGHHKAHQGPFPTRIAADLRRDLQKAMDRNAVDLSVRFVEHPAVYDRLTKGQGRTQTKRLLAD